MPWVYCTVGRATLPHSGAELAPHSMKWMRETLGRRIRSSMVNTRSRLTRPLIIRRCLDGSMSHQPWWWRSKCRPLGVMMPNRPCNGVKLTDACDTRVRPGLSRRCRLASHLLGLP
jgi:hypothetical protein